MSDKTERVRVVVRVRPMSTKEVEDGRKVAVKAEHSRAEITITDPETNAPRVFTFDHAYGAESTQAEV
jgi:kinesin family member 3B